MRLLLSALVALAACKDRGELVAPSGEHRLAARDQSSGVTVILTTGAWQGAPADLEGELTVVHVLVANLGKEPILLAPGNVDLVDRRGFRYDLLDPGATFHLASDEPRTGAAYGRSYRAEYDIGRSENFQWFEAIGDIAELAMPWGVLEPGTQMRGYLYFEPMVQQANGGKLTWHFGTPDHRAVVDTVFELAVAR
jgi:hypothetical protein